MRTTIQIDEKTRDILRDKGKKSETYDVIILRLIKEAEKKTLMATQGIKN